MKILLKIFAIFVLFEVINCYESYKDYKVYDVIPSEENYESFMSWQYIEGVDFWKQYAANRASKVMIAPNLQKDFESFLSLSNIPYQILINDVEVTLEEERQNMTRNRREKEAISPNMTPDFSVFWSSTEMETYSSYLAREYPNFVQLETLTFSPGGRRIYALKVSSGTFGQKPIIAMESGMHAREWVCPPTVFYLLHRIIENPVSRAELLANVDWLIIPMQNPDGYEHSRTVNRLWRQNRRQITPTCIGADLNRNWQYSWRAATGTQPCGSLTFPGQFAMSEPENFQLDNIVGRYANNIKLYLSVHSFGDMVLWPWGYSGSPGWIHSHVEHQALGNLWRQAILNEGGRSYVVGNVANVLGNAFGAVDDHMAGHYEIPYVYTLELTSGFQFTYPEERIEALSRETFHGYRAMALFIGQQFG